MLGKKSSGTINLLYICYVLSGNHLRMREGTEAGKKQQLYTIHGGALTRKIRAR